MKQVLVVLLSLLTAATLTAQNFNFPLKPFKVRVAAQGGLSKVFNDDIRSGNNFGAEFTIPYDNAFGIGVKFSDSCTKSFDDNIMFLGTYGSITNFISCTRHCFFVNLGIGAIRYDSDRKDTGDTIRREGYTLGGYAGIQYDYRITNTLAIGAEISTIIGKLDSIRESVGGGKSASKPLHGNDRIPLNRFDANIGLRFYL